LLEKLEKKLRRLEKKYDKAKGPIERARIAKSAESVIRKMDKIRGKV